MDLIDRQEAIDALDCINGIEEVLRSLPSVQMECHEARQIELTDSCIEKLAEALKRQKTGRWIKIAEGLMVTEYECSECGRSVRDDTGYSVVKDYPFCHCGARMKS